MTDTPRKPRIIDSPDPERPPAEPEPAREKLRLGSKEITEVNRPLEATTRPIVVKEILVANLAKTVPAEKPLDLRRRKSRRKQDYWVCLAGGNLIILGTLYLCTGSGLGALTFGGPICGVFAVTLTWIMWQVMSDY